MDAAHGSSRSQLGEILLAAGLLTEPQLAQALDEQKSTGKRLGEIVVDRGFLSPGAIANALAEQHGSLLKTEYGFGTGLGNRLRERAPQDPENGAGRPTAIDAQTAVIEELRMELKRQAEKVDALEAARSEPPEKSGADRERLIEELQSTMRRREGELTHLRLESEKREQALQAEVEKRETVIAQLRAKIQAQQAELEDLKQVRPEPEPVPATEVRIWTEEQPLIAAPSVQTSHLLRVPQPNGFVLVERPGPAPQVGSEVELPDYPGVRFIVSNLARGPLDGRYWAYLQRGRDAPIEPNGAG